MKNNRRASRINDEFRRELAEIIHTDLNDPRISQVVSVNKADVTQDLKYCKVYVSVLGGDAEKAAVMDGIRSASGFIRKLLAERVNLRQTPELQFVYDDAIEHGIKINKLISEITRNTGGGADKQHD